MMNIKMNQQFPQVLTPTMLTIISTIIDLVRSSKTRGKGRNVFGGPDSPHTMPLDVVRI